MARGKQPNAVRPVRPRESRQITPHVHMVAIRPCGLVPRGRAASGEVVLGRAQDQFLAPPMNSSHYRSMPSATLEVFGQERGLPDVFTACRSSSCPWDCCSAFPSISRRSNEHFWPQSFAKGPCHRRTRHRVDSRCLCNDRIRIQPPRSIVHHRPALS